MEPQAIVILVLAVVGLVGGLAYVGYNMVRPRFPKGRKKTLTNKEWTVHIINAPEGVQTKCLQAHQALVEAIRKSRIKNTQKALDELAEVCILFSDKEADFPPNSASYQTSMKGSGIGKHIPLAVIKAKYFLEIIETGEPVIHELIHAIERLDGTVIERLDGTVDYEHDDTIYWKAAGGKDSVQAMAQVAFRETRTVS